ncbi:universal stress protein [Pusillimonas sp. TS35]|uniref:universal stress protein n=1 Tax=Paracandidimonas lactea TaxID=2895524 RepID=UPI0013719C64|nr:universal stress protein [Paracandidimonas lactea]MYN12918.1 universal stress protein [Pusillimonas sp. TS35]
MLRRIAVHLDLGADSRRRLEFALAMATRHQAVLLGLYASYLLPAYTPAAEGMMRQALDILEAKQKQEKARVEHEFHGLAKHHGVQSTWLTGTGTPAQFLARQARYADVLVISQENIDDREAGSGPGFVAEVLMSTGRPVVMVPSAGTFNKAVGERVLCCWDGGRESARALGDAAPILQHASKLFVLGMDAGSTRMRHYAENGGELVAYCAAHGYPTPKQITRDTSATGVGETILNTAADNDADLIVMGAYGHSRLREWVLGGATNTILESMTIPVLFSR